MKCRPKATETAPEADEAAPEAPGSVARVRVFTGGVLALTALAVVGLALAAREPSGDDGGPIRGRFRRQAAPVTTLAFAPDGRTLVLGRLDGATALRDLERGGAREVDAEADPGPARAPVLAVAFSPDGRALASAGPGRSVRIRDARTGEALAELAGHSGQARSVAFSPDGRTLASGSVDGEIKLWDVATGRELVPLADHADEVRALAFAPDGRALASGSFDGSIRLWEVPGGQLRSTLRPSGGRRVYGLAFAPDGRSLAFSVGASLRGEKGGVSLWDLGDRPEGVRFLGHDSFASVAFSPDGRTLATGGGGRVVTLWDVETGRRRATLDGHEGYIDSLAFSPDGLTIATGGQDALVGLYDLRPDARPVHKL